MRSAEGGWDDPFDVLGLDETATAAEVKAAFRRLAMATHPDHSVEPGASKRFQRVRDAYEALSAPSLRQAVEARRARLRPKPFAAFDAGIRAASEAAAAAPRHPVPPGMRRGRGPDIARTLRVTLEEAWSGGVHTLVNAPRQCSFCLGRGRFPTRELRACPDCDGRGASPCATCSSTGGARVARCGFCGGTKEVRDPGVDVAIPAGATDGSTVTLPGHGAPGREGGPAGDLVVTVAVAPHDTWRRRGNDLHADLVLPEVEASSGTVATLVGIDGRPLRASVPPGTSRGDRLVVPGRGMPGATGRSGDAILTVATRAVQARVPAAG